LFASKCSVAYSHEFKPKVNGVLKINEKVTLFIPGGFVFKKRKFLKNNVNVILRNIEVTS
jgi:hypothetical protein